jgi:hypothetical protein
LAILVKTRCKQILGLIPRVGDSLIIKAEAEDDKVVVVDVGGAQLRL